jgi:AraC-like DNA-binding protein
MAGNEINLLAIILIFGSLILLAFLTISNPLKVNRKANFWFGISLLVWSTFWTEEIVSLLFNTTVHAYFSVLIRFIQFFLPIIIYFSVVFFTNPNYQFRIADFKYLLFPVIFLTVLLVQLFSDEEYPVVLKFVLTGLIYIQVFFLIPASYIKIRRHQKRLVLFASNTVGINLKWLEYIVLLIFLTGIISGIYNVYANLALPNTFMNVLFLFVVFSIAYYTLKQKEIFPMDKKQRDEIILIGENESPAELKRKLMPDDELDRFKVRLNQLMDQEKPYLDSELNLLKLAELLQLTSHQLSYVINTGFNENFFQFINKYRVEKAKELLLNEKMNKLSILGIAFESGFNSKTSFNTTFKKITGQTPSEFKKGV